MNSTMQDRDQMDKAENGPESRGRVSPVSEPNSNVEGTSSDDLENALPDILYEMRYVNKNGEDVYRRLLPCPADEIELQPETRSPVMKVVETRQTWLRAGAPELVVEQPKEQKDIQSNSQVSDSLGPKSVVVAGEDPRKTVDETRVEKVKEVIKLPPFDHLNDPYIEIYSPAVREALRSVCDYSPHLNFDMRSLKLYWPYPTLVYYDSALEEYAHKFGNPKCNKADCSGLYAQRHIGVVRSFIQRTMGKALEEERKRHERGYATFDMLWLLYKLGEDVMYDELEMDEYEPWVIREVQWQVVDGGIRSYLVTCFHLAANTVEIGPSTSTHTIQPFSGERKITSLRAFPFKCLEKGKDGKTPEEVKAALIERGKKFFQLRKKGVWDFRGQSLTFPRRTFEGIVMIDADQFCADEHRELNILDQNFEVDNAKLADPKCCDICRPIIESQQRPFKFSGYSAINPLTAEGVTEHQYLICDRRVEAFVFKHRVWEELDISGVQPVNFDRKMLDTLVLEPHIKKMIQSLTNQYIKGLKADEARQKSTHDPKELIAVSELEKSSWSADFIKGKGEGLIFLLHGKPGVGKTYTAECIAANAERPLLTLICTDIGTNPAQIEKNLVRWFKLAANWNTIMLIDEADIYMEHRKVQDLERNNLVAGFLRAMEYYKGILFLTTNRVGTFDEAFISRINLTIYYPPFTPKARCDVWESFFSKLEREKEDKMRIHNNTRDYVEESEELEQLQWNGREIRNSFQIAVALAEAEGEKDARGRIVITKDHIRSTVEMSKAFKHYMKKLNKKDEDAMAAVRGNRYDSAVLSEETAFR